MKANIKKHFVCGGVILLCYVYLLTHEISDAEVYGFWAGLWQGGIFLPKFIISLFLDNVKFIAKNGTSQEYGAREIIRIINQEIKPMLVDEILFGKLSNGGEIAVTNVDGKFIYS